MAAGLFFHFWNLKDVRSDREREENLKLINELDSEMDKYRTLLATDPWLQEYSRLDESQEEEKMQLSNNTLAADAKKPRG